MNSELEELNVVGSTLMEHVQATPVPQPYYADNLLVCGILACTFILAIVLSDRKHYLFRLLKDFFLPRENTIEGIRTTNIVYLRIFMYSITFASTSLSLALYAIGKSFETISHGMLWAIIGAMVLLFYLLKLLLFAATNRIFFDSITTKTWEQGYACWTILSGIPLYLLAVVAIFFNLSSQSILLLLIACFAILEMCLLYKAFHIFSAKKYGILQIFIYLCTLELMPLLVAGKALVLFV